MNSEAVLLENVAKSFGEVEALKGVSFEVPRGEIFGFLGPNGSGKTTTIRILAGFIRAGSGKAQVLGMDPWNDSVAVKRRLGYLPDLVSVPNGFTGSGFLDYMAKLRGFRAPPPRQRELLDRLELSQSALARSVKGYSTGMQKKVALVQAMQHGPELLIMDEPTEGLDPLMRQVLFSLFREERARGATVFMSSHVLSDVEEICERVALVRDGLIVSAGSIEMLRKGRTRTMLVQFRSVPEDGFRLPGVEVAAKEGATWRLSVRGDVNTVVRELARYDLVDLVFERPSLEELFLGFYRHGVAQGHNGVEGA